MTFVTLSMDCAAAPVAPRGRGIFVGEEPSSATIRGHETPLPPEFATCRNCHDAGREKAPPGSYAPQLVRSWLLEPRGRRGGPPSSYDETSFCKLLRTGIDPAFILVDRVMPRYDMDDAQCSSLWTFLTAHD